MSEKNSIKTILPIHNNEEKLEEINRLLDILSKRKRYSILVTMLLVFQKYNFQKLLKEFLVEGVQEIILANPFKVVSFSGVPFTIKNCFMGMRVIIGKHRIFNKELIEGYEYFNVNLVYTCIFLTDEIAKICQGSKNNKPVHSSLLDDLDIVENTNSSNKDSNTNKITNPLSINNLSENASSSNKNNKKSLLNEKRKRTKNKSDDEEAYEEEEEPEDEDLGSPAAAKKSGSSKNNNKNLGSNFNININISNTKLPSKTEEKAKEESEEHHSKKKLKKNSDNIISLGDSEESDETKGKKGVNKNKGEKLEKEKEDKNDKKKHKNAKSEKKSKKEQKPVNQLFANIFYPKDNNYFKCSLQDFLTVWNFDKSSPVNKYLKDNYQNISKIKNIFNLMINFGEKGTNYLENLIKYIPDMNPAANLSEEDKKKLDENPEMKESKEILDLVEGINAIFREYDNKKKKLVNIYQRIRSTAENIKQGLGVNPGDEKLFLKEDLDYLDMINKRFDDITNEMIPLFNQICDYYKENMVKNISFNMNNLSRILKENDLTLKPFSIFTQNLIGSFPKDHGSINTVNDLMLTEDISVEDREKKFKEIILGEKNQLIKAIEHFKKYAKINSEDNQEDKNKEMEVEN